jgi:hypothetical protein
MPAWYVKGHPLIQGYSEFPDTFNKIGNPERQKGLLFNMQTTYSLPQIQPFFRTSGYRGFVLYSPLGRVGGSNSCGVYTLMGVATTHAG